MSQSCLYCGELDSEITENAHVLRSNNETALYFISFAPKQKIVELSLMSSAVSELHIGSLKLQ